MNSHHIPWIVAALLLIINVIIIVVNNRDPERKRIKSDKALLDELTQDIVSTLDRLREKVYPPAQVAPTSNSPESSRHIREAMFVVEASASERRVLEQKLRAQGYDATLPTSYYSTQVGTFAGRPVCVEVLRLRVNNRWTILLWTPCSMVFDYSIIRPWFESHMTARQLGNRDLFLDFEQSGTVLYQLKRLAEEVKSKESQDATTA